MGNRSSRVRGEEAPESSTPSYADRVAVLEAQSGSKVDAQLIGGGHEGQDVILPPSEGAPEAAAPAGEAATDGKLATPDSSEEGQPPPTCRFCFEGEEDGALIAPCACTGTSRWIHEVSALHASLDLPCHHPSAANATAEAKPQTTCT